MLWNIESHKQKQLEENKQDIDKKVTAEDNLDLVKILSHS